MYLKREEVFSIGFENGPTIWLGNGLLIWMDQPRYWVPDLFSSQVNTYYLSIAIMYNFLFGFGFNHSFKVMVKTFKSLLEMIILFVFCYIVTTCNIRGMDFF
jgi:hypothetical protein